MKLSEIGKEAEILEDEAGIDIDAVMHKLTQETGELNDAIQKYRGIYSKTEGNFEDVKSEFGDVIFNLVSIANKLGISPDEFPALAEMTLKKFKERIELYKKS
ncbi:MAG: MazG nucleotide pyrophosphohydrolase domain-containing protein [Candidatus Gracilibacteria bacterium]